MKRKNCILPVLILFGFHLLAQPGKIEQVEYEGVLYWKYRSVDTINNTPFVDWHLVDTDGAYAGRVERLPRDGKWISFFIEDSTKVASIFEIKYGLSNGKSIQYYINGNKESEYTFRSRVVDGFVRYWNRSGILTLEHQYQYKKYDFLAPVSEPVGEWREWDDKGNLLQVRHYSEGDLHGIQLDYYPNGQVQREAFYKNGERDSSLTTFHDNGQIRSRIRYDNGLFVPDNPHREYHANGRVAGVGNLDDARKTGFWTYFYDTGQKESEGEYGTYVYKHDHGDLYFQVKTGTWQYWYPGGLLKASGTYEDGQEADFDPANFKALPVRKDDWRFFNTRGKRISSGEFNKDQSVNDD